jgi:hypothetical protein
MSDAPQRLGAAPLLLPPPPLPPLRARAAAASPSQLQLQRALSDGEMSQAIMAGLANGMDGVVLPQHALAACGRHAAILTLHSGKNLDTIEERQSTFTQADERLNMINQKLDKIDLQVASVSVKGCCFFVVGGRHFPLVRPSLCRHKTKPPCFSNKKTRRSTRTTTPTRWT